MYRAIIGKDANCTANGLDFCNKKKREQKGEQQRMVKGSATVEVM